MGKPRRCSEAFFNEERAELDRKRKKIRLLQQRKIGDSSSYRDLPEDIPMQLTIGSRVTARLALLVMLTVYHSLISADWGYHRMDCSLELLLLLIFLTVHIGSPLTGRGLALILYLTMRFCQLTHQTWCHSPASCLSPGTGPCRTSAPTSLHRLMALLSLPS